MFKRCVGGVWQSTLGVWCLAVLMGLFGLTMALTSDKWLEWFA